MAQSQRETLRRAQQFLDSLEAKDAQALAATLDPEVTLTMPMSHTGDRHDAARWQGTEPVLGYFGGAFTKMDRIRFINRRVSVAASGATAFVQADGDFMATDDRPYQNVYVFRIDWRDGRIIAIEEYANPLAFIQTFGNPHREP
jgi:ketosteroid isomerase-like protein